MDDFLFMGLDYDTWMNISAGFGMGLLFLCYWLQNMGITGGWAIYSSKIVALIFICIPLLTRWFLSESLILLISACIVLVSGFFMFLRRRGV